MTRPVRMFFNFMPRCRAARGKPRTNSDPLAVLRVDIGLQLEDETKPITPVKGGVL